jgi:hypothetical protein
LSQVFRAIRVNHLILFLFLIWLWLVSWLILRLWLWLWWCVVVFLVFTILRVKVGFLDFNLTFTGFFTFWLQHLDLLSLLN